MAHVKGWQVRAWMREHIEDYRDPQTDEVITTHLEKGAISQFTIEDADLADAVEGWAAEITYADTQRRLHQMPGAVSGLINSRDSSWF